ncbi:hypothetical protein H5410_039999 [Solanum commersonii]|uniref:F-box/LRR-repeat protein 15/At3g58940/PEG3-like LRR domain-containing protein n=1 Tax=Solanum commersonii TaxID=4109 RepID=A0A9J5XNT4_SOLCO|nr:hypothetical protein H5410_039999 [Solanum commersonii]
MIEILKNVDKVYVQLDGDCASSNMLYTLYRHLSISLLRLGTRSGCTGTVRLPFGPIVFGTECDTLNRYSKRDSIMIWYRFIHVHSDSDPVRFMKLDCISIKVGHRIGLYRYHFGYCSGSVVFGTEWNRLNRYSERDDIMIWYDIPRYRFILVPVRFGLVRFILVPINNPVKPSRSDPVVPFQSVPNLNLYRQVYVVSLIPIGLSSHSFKSFTLNNQIHVYDKETITNTKNMPELHHLQLFGTKMTNGGLETIISACPHLESLDLRRCLNVHLGGDIGKRCSQ